MEFSIRPVAMVRSTRLEAIDDNWDSEHAVIELVDEVPDEAIAGLETFSHVEVICVAHLASDVPPGSWSRRPRGNPQWPQVGVFAQRNKDRPNRLLLSVVEVLEVGARSIRVRGLDAVDGTPVVDIKPVFDWSGPRGDIRAPAWSQELGVGYF